MHVLLYKQFHKYRAFIDLGTSYITTGQPAIFMLELVAVANETV